MKLSATIHQFFGQYLPQLKGVSNNTLHSYRQTFKLLIPFAASYHGIQINSLKNSHLSWELIVAFLQHLETQRGNRVKTRNQRLAAIKSFAKMIRLIYPEQTQWVQAILSIPQKRGQKPLIGFLYPQEILQVLAAVDLKRYEGMRDYTLLHLLYDSGARASEIARLELDSFDYRNQSLTIVGKGNRLRQIALQKKCADLIKIYIANYRLQPKPRYLRRLFINQRREQMTRHGVYRICKKYLHRALPAKRLKHISPVHSFRHSCAVRMMLSGCGVSEIRIHLGHEDLQSTMVYLHLDLSRKKQIQNQLIEYTRSLIAHDRKLDELVDWDNKEEILTWLDSL